MNSRLIVSYHCLIGRFFGNDVSLGSEVFGAYLRRPTSAREFALDEAIFRQLMTVPSVGELLAELP